MVEPRVAFHIQTGALDEVLDGVLILDEDSSVVFANRFARSKLWDDPDAAAGRKVGELLPNPADTTWDEIWQRLRTEGKRLELNFLSVESLDSKKIFFFDAVVLPRRSIDGEFQGAVCLLHFASMAEKLAMEVEAAKETIEGQLRQMQEFTSIGDEIVGETDLGQVLKRVAAAIKEHSDYRRVVVSRFMGSNGERETACAGVSPEEEESIRSTGWSSRLNKELLHERFKMGHSYYIPHHLRDLLPVHGVPSKIPEVETQDWHPNDFLFIPLYGRGHKLIGIISVDDPRDGRAPTPDSLRPLELFAQQAARAIEETQLKKELVGTKDNLKMLIDSTPDAIVATDAHGVVTFYSDGAERMFGYLPEEIVGKRLSEFYSDDPEKGVERAKSIMRELVNSETKTILGKVLEFPRRDGGRVPIIISAGLLKDEAGEIVGTIGVARDISKDVKLRQQIMEKNKKLEAKNRELEEFVYIASHDLQAPLVSIQGFAAKLSREYESQLGRDGLHYISRLNANVLRMSMLLKSLLDLSRASTKPMDKTPTDLSAILDDVLGDYSEQIRELNATIDVRQRLPVVSCDGIQIAQVMSNLVGNALKYSSTDKPPIIVVDYEEKDSCYTFRLADNGIGIAESEREAIFRPFKRLRQRPVEGIGIGLSISQRIIERAGGRIWAEPNPEGGSVFYFELPK